VYMYGEERWPRKKVMAWLFIMHTMHNLGVLICLLELK
jgi:hypothetical protein